MRRGTLAVRMNKPWIDLNEFSLGKIASHLGVYQLANKNYEIVYIGVANAMTKFGLKGELLSFLNRKQFGACYFRIEVNMAYKTRYVELLQVFYYDHKQLPIGNTDIDPGSLGQLRPGGDDNNKY
jgi:hypothetical protein